MDTMEQTSQRTPLSTDYQAYDRIWQRVSPTLDPYPQARMESAGTAGTGAGSAAACAGRWGPCGSGSGTGR